MVYCFAFGCRCHDAYTKCSFFRFPNEPKELATWEKLCRRGDRQARAGIDRLCSCHFINGERKNGPSLNFHNAEKSFSSFPDAEVKRKRKRKAPPTMVLEEDTVNYQFEPLDHSYSYTCEGGKCKEELDNIMKKMNELKIQIEQTEAENKELKKKVDARKLLTIEMVKEDDELMLLYTSLTYDVFNIIHNALCRFDLTYWSGWTVTRVNKENQLFLTFIKLRLSLKDLDLAFRFNVSRATVTNIIYTYITALHELLCEGILFKLGIPSQLKCKGSMPKSFKDFVSARVVMDATEISQDIPSELNTQACSYSTYKGRHTLKAVTSVAPNAALVHCTKLYPGSVSDNAIVENSELLKQFNPGDLIIADKGFTMFDKLPAGVSLNIPPFLAGKSQFTKKEAELCTKIGRARIHVERVNERIKNFEILNHIPAHYRHMSTKIFQLCCVLVNFQAPMLKEIADGYEM